MKGWREKLIREGRSLGIGASDGTEYDALTCHEAVSMGNTRAVSEPAETVAPSDSWVSFSSIFQSASRFVTTLHRVNQRTSRLGSKNVRRARHCQ